MNTCTHPGCVYRARRRGFCKRHHPGKPSPEERFWAKTERRGDCIVWTASHDPHGYGKFGLNGKVHSAHRVAWEWANGRPVPAGLQLDHLCRVRNCVNPDHLEPVTPRENTMRSTSWAAVKARQTHCLRGHAFDEENTYLVPRGRHCRQCQAERNRARATKAPCVECGRTTQTHSRVCPSCQRASA